MALAKIEGFVTRAEAGLRPPRSVSHNITPSRGGVTFHWGGPAPKIDSHADCYKVWRAWQRYHMDTHGWQDLAYTMSPCNHGFVFAGRGAGVRTAANGTNDGNDRFYAVVWLGGKGMRPTLAAIRAALWCVMVLRRKGKAGKAVVPHRKFTGSECPGPAFIKTADEYDGKRVSDVPRTVRPGRTKKRVVRLRTLLRRYGHQTGAAANPQRFDDRLATEVRKFKTKRLIGRSAVVGPKTWRALLRPKKR